MAPRAPGDDARQRRDSARRTATAAVADSTNGARRHVEALDEAVERVVSELLTSRPQAVREAKRLIRERPQGEETAHIAARLRASEEGQEGLRAFLERGR